LGFKGGAVIIDHSFAQALSSQPALSPAKGKLSKYIESGIQVVSILFSHALLFTYHPLGLIKTPIPMLVHEYLRKRTSSQLLHHKNGTPVFSILPISIGISPY
jgi:hypothetical protein